MGSGDLSSLFPFFSVAQNDKQDDETRTAEKGSNPQSADDNRDANAHQERGRENREYNVAVERRIRAFVCPAPPFGGAKVLRKVGIKTLASAETLLRLKTLTRSKRLIRVKSLGWLIWVEPSVWLIWIEILIGLKRAVGVEALVGLVWLIWVEALVGLVWLIWVEALIGLERLVRVHLCFESGVG